VSTSSGRREGTERAEPAELRENTGLGKRAEVAERTVRNERPLEKRNGATDRPSSAAPVATFRFSYEVVTDLSPWRGRWARRRCESTPPDEREVARSRSTAASVVRGPTWLRAPDQGWRYADERGRNFAEGLPKGKTAP
jgi:hypothetical protein